MLVWSRTRPSVAIRIANFELGLLANVEVRPSAGSAARVSLRQCTHHPVLSPKSHQERHNHISSIPKGYVGSRQVPPEPRLQFSHDHSETVTLQLHGPPLGQPGTAHHAWAKFNNQIHGTRALRLRAELTGGGYHPSPLLVRMTFHVSPRCGCLHGVDMPVRFGEGYSQPTIRGKSTHDLNSRSEEFD